MNFLHFHIFFVLMIVYNVLKARYYIHLNKDVRPPSVNIYFGALNFLKPYYIIHCMYCSYAYACFLIAWTL